MKHQVYISDCTEFEAGWGQRPDGFLITESLEAMNRKIKESNKMGSREYFWRYDTPKLVFCDDETFAIIKEKMEKNDFASFENKEKKNLNLFKKI